MITLNSDNRKVAAFSIDPRELRILAGDVEAVAAEYAFTVPGELIREADQ